MGAVLLVCAFAELARAQINFLGLGKRQCGEDKFPGPWGVKQGTCFSNNGGRSYSYHCAWEASMLVSAAKFGGCSGVMYKCDAMDVGSVLQLYQDVRPPYGSAANVKYTSCCMRKQCQGFIGSCGEPPNRIGLPDRSTSQSTTLAPSSSSTSGSPDEPEAPHSSASTTTSTVDPTRWPSTRSSLPPPASTNTSLPMMAPGDFKKQLIWGGVIAAGSSAVAGAAAGAVAGVLAGQAEAKSRGAFNQVEANRSRPQDASVSNDLDLKLRSVAPARAIARGDAGHPKVGATATSKLGASTTWPQVTDSSSLNGLSAFLVCLLAFLVVVMVGIVIMCLRGSGLRGARCFGNSWIASGRTLSHQQMSRFTREDCEIEPDMLEQSLEPELAASSARQVNEMSSLGFKGLQ